MGKRLRRHDRTVKVCILYCARCKDHLNLAEGEAAPLKAGLVPYCGSCFDKGYRIAMKARWYKSGPTDLYV